MRSDKRKFSAFEAEAGIPGKLEVLQNFVGSTDSADRIKQLEERSSSKKEEEVERGWKWKWERAVGRMAKGSIKNLGRKRERV